MASYQYVYVMKGLGKTFPGGRQVLRDIWLSFFPGAKIGVLGLNGAGKSTLLRIMAGIETEFTGEAWAEKKASVGYLSQEPELDPSKDVAGNVFEGVAETKALLDRFEAGQRPLRRGPDARGDGRPDRRTGGAAGGRSTRPTPGTWSAPWRSPWTRCAARPATPT